MEFLKEFEYRKVLIEPNSDKYVRLRCPSYLKEIYCKNNKEKFPESGKYGDTVKWSSDYGRLIINSSVIENMITKVVNHTVNHLQTILREPAVGQVSAIMVVGGFGTSKVLQHILLQSFPQQNFVFPADAPKAVLYGAVMYGHRPDAIFARICSSTYGIGQFRRFDAKIHEPSKKEVVNGVEWCKDCFIKFIEEGAKVIAGESKFTTTLTAVSPFQGELVVPIYVSKQDKNPLYVTDSGVEYIGELVVEMLNDVGTGNRRVQVTIEMGGTELNVSGKNVATGKSYKATLQFLTR